MLSWQLHCQMRLSALSRQPSRKLLLSLLKPLVTTIAILLCLRLLLDEPSPPAHTKALVIASTAATEGDAAWLADVPLDWRIHVYSADRPLSPALTVPENRGNEAMVYLTYIIDHYHDLPDVVLFHHDHLRSWHQGLSSLTEVSSLRTAYVVEKGYVSTRCLSNCENVMPVSAAPPVALEQMPEVRRDGQLGSLLNAFLETEKHETLPKLIAAPCCAQFAASREAIRGRSREWWTELRQWLIDTPLGSSASGRLMEWTWHIWLGEGAYSCSHSHSECMCNVFGRQCDAIPAG
ncbi:Uu.00g145480.m01.CDS01 [Anthostomella pinea]|uniref:Uu.00g145480.m01.CDS01 n=1 Tax=Anthostomella pinea TaxID=933095 RepID=A0AAI8VS79_9PEZI|nr:Uu.00g145480.m01.CDS01 [Anthostomella pinea]